MKGIILLTIACAIWGLGFAGTRFTLEDYTPIWSNSLRYAIAGILAFVIMIFRNDFPKLMKNKKELVGGLICSVVLIIALQLQTIGISMTTMAKAGFLTVFYAIFTPIIYIFVFKHQVRKTFWFLLVMAMFGIMLMNGFDLSRFNLGDLFTLVSALFFSFHILATDYYANDVDPVRFNFLQCIIMGAIGTVFALLYEGPVSLSPLFRSSALSFPSSLWGFLILSIFSSLVAFSLQIIAQRNIPAHIVGLVFLSESLFASIFGYIFFKETLDATALSGAFIILVAVALVPRYTNLKKE